MQVNALKEESDFLTENLLTVTNGIVRLNKNVVFCSECSGTAKCLKEPIPSEADRQPVPDSVSEVIPTGAEFPVNHSLMEIERLPRRLPP